MPPLNSREVTENSGKAVVEGEYIVIRVPINALPVILEGAIGLSSNAAWQESGVKVKEPKKFANEICLAINEEDEEGTTRFHKMFDGAMFEAIEQGAEGIEE